VWSFPGCSIIIIIDFFHITGKWFSFDIEKLGDSANGAIWELSDNFGGYKVAARGFLLDSDDI